MRPLGVVVLGEAVELALEQLLGRGRLLLGQVLLERLVEALDLAAGLGVIGPRVPRRDAQAEQLGLHGAESAAHRRGEDAPVVGQEALRIAPDRQPLCARCAPRRARAW